MLDESLPTFFLKQNNSPKHLWSIYFGQHGNEPSPAYALRYPDPLSSSSRNRYAVALYDPYVPDVVYGEVLITPDWTQPSLSADAVRQNGGATPPPEPILPTRFTVQLYNPDQQITIRYKHKTWNTPAAWEFEMPQHSFRQPSASTLDHALTDPAAADVTPKLKFSWRKDGKLSKDLTCLLSGTTSTMSEGSNKTKSKEPDITISIYKALRELTLYEPNLYRVEMEDFKGLEVVLLLGAVTIRDVYFQPIKDAFRVLTSAAPVRPGGPAAANAAAANKPTKPAQQPPTASGGLNPATTAGPPGAPPRPRITIPEHETQPPPQEQRSQTEVEAENARRQKQQGGKAQEEPRRTKAEEKARRKRQEEIDKETRRLQKLYGREEAQARTQTPPSSEPKPRPPPRPNQQQPARHYYRPSVPQPGPRPGPYLQVPGQDGRHHSSTQFLQPRPQSTAAIRPAAPARPDLQPKKSSFFGLLRASGPDDGKLSKKRSSMF
ncbi:hypothetical protein PHISP_00577 [Aspergillus sp. HF37]|nr:hypothetical protein PHISP_00577 [Aspergillus sp. HF37]